MMSEPIIVEFSDGRTINLCQVVTTQNLTKSKVKGHDGKMYDTMDVIINVPGYELPEVHAVQIMTTSNFQVVLNDPDDIDRFQTAWRAYRYWS